MSQNEANKEKPFRSKEYNMKKKTVLTQCPKCKNGFYIDVNGEKEKKIRCPYCKEESTVKISDSGSYE